MQTAQADAAIKVLIAGTGDSTKAEAALSRITAPHRVIAGHDRVQVGAVAKVLLNMDRPVYALAYGLGYASGTFLGITIEQHLGQDIRTLAP